MSVSLIHRRSFLSLGTLGLVARANIFAGTGSDDLSKEAQSLAFHNLHTGEKLDVVYCVSGQYVPESLADINRILRDHRSGEICDIAPSLLDTLFRVRSLLNNSQPFEVVSGYRSPATNARLRREGHGVAQNSLHMKGMAIDLRLPGCSLPVLRTTAISLKAGGVGYYPGQFVHIDVGRVRTW